jgi:hypothetical protein
MTLKSTLYNLVTASQRNKTIQEIRLQRGLIVSIRVTPATTRLGLWRTGSRPSLAEWRAVLNAWPYPVRLDEPAEIAERGMLGLSGSWQTPTQTKQKTFIDEDVTH